MKEEEIEKRKEELTPEQNNVCFGGGTEAPFSGKYYKHDEDGTYRCVVCGNVLFSSDAKFDGTEPGLMGWPSFDEIASENSVEFREDLSMGMKRTEVVCKNCEAHLGHVFDASDAKTGKHYCINSAALDFQKKEE